MNCPSCGAPMRIQSASGDFTCEYCKSIFIPPADDEGVAVLEETPDVQCPVCSLALWNATLQGVHMHSCKRCRGMLIPMDAFEALIEQLRALQTGSGDPPSATDPHDLERKINCPVCHRHMETHVYFGGGNVVIDDCESCSVNWLDHGELLRIVRAPQARMFDDSL